MPVPAVIPTSNRVPGIYLKVSLGVGVRSAGENARTILLLANKTSAGTGTPDTVVYDLPDEETAITLGGVGSELHRSYVKAAKANPSATIKAIIVTESAGTAASQTITVANAATAAGTVRVWVAGEFVDVPIASGDANTATATAIEAAIDDQSAWPVTASVLAGVVTVTAKHKGPRGNSIGIRVEVFDVTAQTVVVGGSYLASGATSDTPATALATALASRVHYIVSGYDDATNIDLLKTHVLAQALPETGRRTRVICAFSGSFANGITLATGRNEPRVQVIQHVGCESPTSEIAAAFAGVLSRYESLSCAYNLDGIEVPGIVASPRTADAPTSGNKQGAVNNGVTLLTGTAPGSSLRIMRSVTSKSLDASTQPDYRVLDTSKVAVPDFIADDLAVFIADRFPNALIAPDDPNGEPPAAGTVTPAMMKDALYERLRSYDAGNRQAVLALLTGVDDLVDQLVVEIAATPAGRFNVAVPLDVVDGLHQVGVDVRQLG